MSLVEVAEGRHVIKRDGKTTQEFDKSKIVRAISGAWRDVHKEVNAATVDKIANWVEEKLAHRAAVSIEKIQDTVETALMHFDMFDVAKAYIIYRHDRTNKRGMRQEPDAKALADYIHAAKYARFLPSHSRRETYEETINRVEAMHLRKFPQLDNDIRWAFDFVRDRRVLPSMRAMQFAGPAIEAENARLFNCTATLIDRPRVFSEALYFLLCGAGVGYSVRFDHVNKLPAVLRISREVEHYVIEDSIVGWATAVDKLFESFMKTGKTIEFAYHNIRPAGAALKTSGGRAPGHLSLKEMLENVRDILLHAQGRKLRPIECHDLMCHIADAVLSGGIRRSSLISFFSPEDGEMVYAKTGNWLATHPWRQNANNSMAIRRDASSEKTFRRVFKMSKEWGEPGFCFVDHDDLVGNPCLEILMNPRTWSGVTGFSGCNLTELNGAKFSTFEDFNHGAKAATIIGTLQAAYTDFNYLTAATKEIFDRDALLGVSITGMLDSPDIACNPEYQKEIAEKCVAWNAEYAARIGINSAARVTCVKPSGTASLELGGVASGIHAHHARRYIRRVTANELETVFQHFKEKNPHMCVKKPNGDWVIEFPIKAPDGAIVKSELNAIEFLKRVKSTQENWVKAGVARPDPLTGLTFSHNVSNTVTVGEGEWDAVEDFIWENRECFTGVSLLANFSDKVYPFAPCEEITTPADEARWNQIVSNYQPVDYVDMLEIDDATSLKGEAACAGGVCNIT